MSMSGKAVVDCATHIAYASFLELVLGSLDCCALLASLLRPTSALHPPPIIHPLPCVLTTGPSTRAKLRFAVPTVRGASSVVLYLVSDCYLGLDQEYRWVDRYTSTTCHDTKCHQGVLKQLK